MRAGTDRAHAYELSEESGRFAARISVPGGVDRSVMPYQEEPRDVPLQFSIDVTPDRAGGSSCRSSSQRRPRGRDRREPPPNGSRATLPASTAARSNTTPG